MPRKISPAKYKNNSLHIERAGAKALRKALNEWMAEMQKAMVKGLNQLIRKDIGQNIAMELTNWEIIEAEGIITIKPAILDIINKSGENTTRLFSAEASFDIVNMVSVELAETITARMVREVTDETQKAIAISIREGLEAGNSIPQIARKIKPRVGLTTKQIQAVANFEENLLIAKPHFKREQIDRAVNRYERKKHRERTEMIARSESSRANAEGSLNVYEANEVEVEWIAVAGNDFDPENCQDNDGQIFSIAEARGRIPVHPNCECIWGPHIARAA